MLFYASVEHVNSCVDPEREFAFFDESGYFVLVVDFYDSKFADVWSQHECGGGVGFASLCDDWLYGLVCEYVSVYYDDFVLVLRDLLQSFFYCAASS